MVMQQSPHTDYACAGRQHLEAVAEIGRAPVVAAYGDFEAPAAVDRLARRRGDRIRHAGQRQRTGKNNQLQRKDCGAESGCRFCWTEHDPS